MTQSKVIKSFEGTIPHYTDLDQAQVFAENGIDVEVLSRLNYALEKERSIK
jgi:hypothetical protein